VFHRIVALALGITSSACAVTISHAAGAYAVGRSEHGSWGGGAKDAANSADASRDALVRCGQYGPGCAVVTNFSGSCFSLAIPPGTNGFYWATRATLAEARDTVMNHCLASGRPCEVKVGFCDVRGLPAAMPAPTSLSSPVALPSTTQAIDRAVSVGDIPLPPIDGKFALILAVGLMVAIGMAVAFRKQSFRAESGFFTSNESAQHYDSEAGRFRAMARRLDAETDLAESFINAKRRRAELDDIEEMFRD
jgi:Domain of unknown function (DUF4189)